MNNIELEVMPRTILGKEVKKLRRQNIIPVNVYGHGVDSTALQADTRSLKRALSRAGKSTLLTLMAEGQKPRTVVVRNIQLDPRNNSPLHVDFYQVNLAEKMHLQVRLNFVGELPVAVKGGALVHSLNAVEVECLPQDMPRSMEVDLSALTDFNAPIHVKDLVAPPNVIMITDLEAIVAMVEAPKVAEEVTPAAGAEEKESEGVAS
ncbi:MAG: 50S ribosomal protein L25 [Dehalococcoidia bacterium]|nr:50S ribosomal protein L25 [Dehalococcoidia bacterium]